VFHWPDLEEAVTHAFSHPLRPAAQRDAVALAGARLTDAAWTLAEWVLVFDTGLQLRIWPEEPEVRWALEPAGGASRGGEVCRAGSPPVRLWWLQWQQAGEVDGSTLAGKRLGAVFRDLFVNDSGLFVYFRDHLILCFQTVRREANGQSMLYVYEDD
jgi:hypothetical protein